MKLLPLFAIGAFVGLGIFHGRPVSGDATPLAEKLPSPRSETFDVVVLGDSKIARMQITVDIEGKSPAILWGEAFAGLVHFFDRDHDGGLNEKEASLLPSAFNLRQLQWGMISPHSGAPPAWRELDLDRDGLASVVEVSDYYRRQGFGSITVGVGKMSVSSRLTDALLTLLDTDRDGTVNEREWKAAPDTLRRYDSNDDELIGPGELVARAAYPGTAGNSLLAAPTPTDKPSSDPVPLIVIPSREADTYWATEILKRRDINHDGQLDETEAGLPLALFTKLDGDGNKRLSAAELVGWRKAEADIRVKADFGKTANAPPALVVTGIQGENLNPVVRPHRLRIRADQGQQPELIAASLVRFRTRFVEADVNRDGFIDKTDKQNLSDLRRLTEIADRDADGRLSEAEFAAWLKLQEMLARGQVLLTVLIQDSGLFELLDADGDAALSVRELRTAFDRLQQSDCLVAGQFDRARLPRHLFATVARGHPVSAIAPPVRPAAPDWFRAMDRNHDGDLSRREFAGPEGAFDRLDSNKDGLLDPVEASAARK